MCAQKRKHETLTLNQKLDILRKVDSGMSYSQLANLYNIGRSTVYDLRKNRDKIENYVKTANAVRGQRLTMKTGDYRELEEALYKWYLKRKNQERVTCQNLRGKALDLYKNIYKKHDFKASDGWLCKFKSRFGIRLKNMKEEQPVKTELLGPPIIEIKKENIVEERHEEDENTPIPPKIHTVSSGEALLAIDTCIKWAEENDMQNETLSTLQKFKNDIILKISFEQHLHIEPTDIVDTILQN